MTFGDAVEAMRKSGKRVARRGWNGRGMFLFFVANWEIKTVTPSAAGIDYDGFKERLPFICMKTADNKIVPWLASQTDILALDWEIV